MSMRNSLNHFAQSKSDLHISRSTFDKSFKHMTTANAGKCIPVFLEETLPGDTFDIGLASIIRMATPIFPVCDDVTADFYFFYVPNRLVWSNWKYFLGENKTGAWTPLTTYSVPEIQPSGAFSVGSIADYFGLSTDPNLTPGVTLPTVSALPFRAYRLIWNEWFRSEALQSPQILSTGDTETDTSLYGSLLPACKFGDYFTTCLPAPQFGASTLIPGFNSDLPVYTDSRLTLGFSNAALGTTTVYPLMFRTNSSTSGIPANTSMGTPSSGGLYFTGGYASTYGSSSGGSNYLFPANLWAKAGAGGTINQLRQAYQVQKILERNARCGTRYRELLYSHFGVQIPDSTVQIPEFLGHRRVTLNMDQVVQTSATGTTGTPIGTTSGYSKTGDYGHLFTKSFTEHGYVIGIMVIRTAQSYSNGLNRLWSRRTLYDFYTPELAQIGEMAVLNKEIWCNSGTPNNAFGYQEAWADYRYGVNKSTGLFNPVAPNNIAAWNYTEGYQAQPILGSTWIQSTDVPLKRTLAVSSNVPDQFLCDLWFDFKATRPMPAYSIPGYSDHF